MGRNDPTPAIVRDYSDDDRDVEVLSTPTSTVTNSPGMGDSGYRVEVVEHDCPHCGFDRMVRRHDVNPEMRDEVRYWCLQPNCRYFVSDSLSYACHGNYPQGPNPKEPAVFEERSDERSDEGPRNFERA